MRWRAPELFVDSRTWRWHPPCLRPARRSPACLLRVHLKREVIIGAAGKTFMLSNRLAGGVMDWALGKVSREAQLTDEPRSATAPANLHLRPLSGELVSPRHAAAVGGMDGQVLYLDGLPIRYLVAGSGVPVVLSHGGWRAGSTPLSFPLRARRQAAYRAL
jgi:hypothetical protein